MRRWPPTGRSRLGEANGSRIGALDLPANTSPELRALLAKAAGPPEPSELADEPAAVAAFVAAFAAVASTEPAADSGAPAAAQDPAARTAGEPSTSPTQTLPDLLRRHLRSLRFAAAAVIAMLVFGGGLAAADALPAPAQRWVSSALGTLGIPVPSPKRGDQVGDAPDRGRTPEPSAPALTVPSPTDRNRPAPAPHASRPSAPSAGTVNGPGTPAPTASPSASALPQRPAPSSSPSSVPTGGATGGAGNGTTASDGTTSTSAAYPVGMQAGPRSMTAGAENSDAEVSADRAPRN
jgi:hypothetical protein